MSWPPKVGELLPRADEAIGVRHKLETYCLNFANQNGAPKARAFRQILGITLAFTDYLEGEILAGIQVQPLSAVRPNPPHGFNCVVEFPYKV